MAETVQLGLPLLQPSQAQKHVTVNEALVRIDGLTQLVLASRSVTTPPTVVTDGVVYAVPVGGVNAWSGRDGELALGVNGGWAFIMPKPGWRAWIADEGQSAVYDGTDWRGGSATLSPFGAGTRIGLAEFDHDIDIGATSTTIPAIPAFGMVLGVTGRVTEEVTGTLSSWQLGTAGATDRFGSGLGLGQGSFARGVLGSPLTYYAPTPLELTATGGDFAGGTVRLAVHFIELSLPSL